MYYVYCLKLNEYEYVGCTNDIRRRKDQHNENARKGKSKLGRWMGQNGIVLSVKDFNVIGKYADRQQALSIERHITKERESAGVKLLNDNYTNDCTRKGKNLGNTAKRYVVIDFESHTAVTVENLRQYCFKKGFDYKLVQRTTKGERFCQQKIKALHEEDWNKVADKQRYLSGRFAEESIAATRAEMIKKTAKEYDVRFPDGHTETVKNLDRFAREHNLTPGTLHATISKNKPTKGYQAFRRI